MAKQAPGVVRAAIPVLLLAVLFSGAARAQTQSPHQDRATEAAVAADVQAVLRRAIQDHPVLAAPAGQPLLTKIMDRHLALRAQGAHPSVAMAEAISDNVHLLVPRAKQQAQVVSAGH